MDRKKERKGDEKRVDEKGVRIRRERDEKGEE